MFVSVAVLLAGLATTSVSAPVAPDSTRAVTVNGSMVPRPVGVMVILRPGPARSSSSLTLQVNVFVPGL
jgi:hypothetical protein